MESIQGDQNENKEPLDNSIYFYPQHYNNQNKNK